MPTGRPACTTCPALPSGLMARPRPPHRADRGTPSQGPTVTSGARAAAAARERVERLFTTGGLGFRDLAVAHVASTFGDTLVTVALAGTLFFSVPSTEARGNVVLYLLLTVAPFAVIGPLLGRLLDRRPSATRMALVGSAVLRIVAAVWAVWLLEGLALFPVAFALLVMSRVHGIARNALLPVALDESTKLVAANARLATISVLGGVVAAPLGGLLVLVLDGRAALVRGGTRRTSWPRCRDACCPRCEDRRRRHRRPRAPARPPPPGAAGAGRHGGGPPAQRVPAPAAGLRVQGHGRRGARPRGGAGRRRGGLRSGRADVTAPGASPARGADGGGRVGGRGRRGLRRRPVVRPACRGVPRRGRRLRLGNGQARLRRAAAGRTCPAATRGAAFTRSETLFQLAWVLGALVPAGIPLPTGIGLVLAGLAALAAQVVYVSNLLLPLREGQQQVTPPR